MVELKLGFFGISPKFTLLWTTGCRELREPLLLYTDKERSTGATRTRTLFGRATETGHLPYPAVVQDDTDERRTPVVTHRIPVGPPLPSRTLPSAIQRDSVTGDVYKGEVR